MHDARKAGPLTNIILHHILRWFDHAAKPPATKNENALLWSWDDFVENHIICRRTDAFRRPPRGEPHDSTASAHAFVDAVFKICHTYHDEFYSKDLKDTIKGLPPSPSEYNGAIEYNRRFTQRQWDDLLALSWDFTGGAFPMPGFLEGYRDRTKIEDSCLPWTIWGNVMVRYMPTVNPEMKRLSAILGTAAKADLSREGSLFGARFTYWQLKRVWVEDRSRAQTATTGPHSNQGILSEHDRTVVEEGLRRYGAFLNSLSEDRVRPLDPDEPFHAIRPSHGFLPGTAPSDPMLVDPATTATTPPAIVPDDPFTEMGHPQTPSAGRFIPTAKDRSGARRGASHRRSASDAAARGSPVRRRRGTAPGQ
ncbi:hypothetical protein NFIA_024070 [Paecilomyces variotii No. 5]|uniref:Uncharacterized protein n=1 Tax=Byssochlamys spectabilis (strain No. 5 / NBRC 109023) TaxID=1356009 RepID=V5HX26_BYSSN|nr:hypothetical protein NFIA_024070 [Paecilomyces variotii No. 5]